MSRLSRRVAVYAPDPVQVVTTRQPSPAPPPVMAHGLLDRAPSPRKADAIVFGDWVPGIPATGPELACRCGCRQGKPGPCWNCGAMVTPGQWLA